MPLRFTLSVAGDVQFDRTLDALSVSAGQMDPLLHEFAADLKKVTAQQFATEGRYASGGWKALSEPYAKRKRAMVDAGKQINGRTAKRMEILRLTDRLKDSLLLSTSPEHVETIANNTLTWGTKVPYAKAHQKPRVGSPLPQRRFLELPESRRQLYARAILTYIRTGKSGL